MNNKDITWHYVLDIHQPNNVWYSMDNNLNNNKLQLAYYNARSYYHCADKEDKLCQFITEAYIRALRGNKETLEYFYDIWSDSK